MNYYERYCGDYGRDTTHLSLTHHGVYTVLLDVQYATELGLPIAYADLYRICRAMTKPEQAAVRAIADDYFPVDEDEGLRWNPRAKREIAKAQDRISASRNNGKKGGNPYKKRLYNEPGCLYAVRLDGGRVKVGIAKDFSKRRYGLTKTHGIDIKTIHVVQVDDMGACEETVFQHFSAVLEGEILKIDENQYAVLVTVMDGLAIREPDGVANGQADSQPSPHATRHKPAPPKAKNGEATHLSGKPDRAGEVRAVFEHWRTVLGHQNAKLDEKRRRAVRQRLVDGYTVEQLCAAVDGCARSAWHMGENDRGRRFDDLEMICRDSKHVDDFLRATQPVSTGLSIAGQQTAANLKEWVEEAEARDARR